jgi:predicted nucleic acid-binding protein
MSKEVVADSSFYICFLDDIKQPQYLLRILDKFDFVMGPVVRKEVEASGNYSYIADAPDIKSFEVEPFGELLSPFFSVSEIEKGETEVIAISFILLGLEHDIKAIIDEDYARKYVEKIIPEVKPHMTGTVGFVRDCFCVSGILTRDESKNLLLQIKGSDFRIKRVIIDEAIDYVEQFGK